MEREFKCKYLGEYIGSAEILQDGGWPLYECEAPDDSNPSKAGKASFDDDSIKYYCRVASSSQNICTGYKAGEEIGLINLFKES